MAGAAVGWQWLPAPSGTSRAFVRRVRRAHPDVLGAKELARILGAERARGEREGRPAVKHATADELVRAGRRR